MWAEAGDHAVQNIIASPGLQADEFPIQIYVSQAPPQEVLMLSVVWDALVWEGHFQKGGMSNSVRGSWEKGLWN